MTNRITLGVDPGATGAIAILADGEVDSLIDMPVTPRKSKGNEVNASALAASLRGVLQKHPGAYVVAILESVNAMPSFSREGEARRGMGSQTSFNFGESFGIVKGVLACLGIGYVLVQAQTWKRHLRLTGCEKDCARTLMIQRFPSAAASLARKKDVGRADALCLALYGDTTEQVARAA